jgi:hypothetical protein
MHYQKTGFLGIPHKKAEANFPSLLLELELVVLLLELLVIVEMVASTLTCCSLASFLFCP